MSSNHDESMDITQEEKTISSSSSSSKNEIDESSSKLVLGLTDDMEIQVRFVAKYISIQEQDQSSVPDVPVNVPLKLTRFGLSEIVNHLAEQDPPRPYDFLVNDEFLTTSLRKYLERKNLSVENGLVLEYVEALPQPASEPSMPHPDWISSVDARMQDLVLTACYDGSMRVLDARSLKQDSTPLAQISNAHMSAIKSARWLLNHHANTADSKLFCSASKDQTVRIWQYDAKTASISNIALCKGHSDSVDCIGVNPTASRFCSGSWDKKLLIWKSDSALDDPHNDANGAQPLKKKKKTNSNQIKNIEPLVSLEGHKHGITSICWPSSLALYSSSYDHSIRFWDPNANQCVQTWTSNNVVTDIDFSLENNLLVSAHNDAILRLWDPRIKEQDLVKSSFKSHTSWTSSVRWSPIFPNMFVSTSYDHTIKVWDIRSRVPLSTITAHTEKVLCVDWMTHMKKDDSVDLFVLSGSADSMLTSHRITGRA